MGRTVVVDHSTDESVALEHGKLFEGFALGHEVRGFHVFLASKEVIELAPGPVVRDLPVPDYSSVKMITGGANRIDGGVGFGLRTRDWR